jgi:hypothetical protein
MHDKLQSFVDGKYDVTNKDIESIYFSQRGDAAEKMEELQITKRMISTGEFRCHSVRSLTSKQIGMPTPVPNVSTCPSSQVDADIPHELWLRVAIVADRQGWFRSHAVHVFEHYVPQPPDLDLQGDLQPATACRWLERSSSATALLCATWRSRCFREHQEGATTASATQVPKFGRCAATVLCRAVRLYRSGRR